MPSSHLILCHPLLLLPTIFPSIRVFSHELALCIRWPKYWSFSFNISPSNEYSGLVSFRIDWLDLLAVQGALKNLLQHHSSQASILLHSATSLLEISAWRPSRLAGLHWEASSDPQYGWRLLHFLSHWASASCICQLVLWFICLRMSPGWEAVWGCWWCGV